MQAHIEPYLPQLTEYLGRYLTPTPTIVNALAQRLQLKTVRKGELVLLAGSPCHYQYFIAQGLLVSYSLDEKAAERVIQLSTENSWTGDLNSYINNVPAVRAIRAFEDSKLLQLARPAWDDLLAADPAFEKLFRILFQNAYIEQTKRVNMMLAYDARKRYEIFIEYFPQLVGRVELRLIASYLDMTPETLSRVRKALWLDADQV
jgi:CRP-like cAMP-binding protein